jgi:ADP-ribose pyrophosphatase
MKPFDRVATEILVDNPWHRYRCDRYVQTDGTTGEYYYIDMPGSAAAIPLFDDGTTVVVRVHRYLLGRDLWEFPIGGMKPGEPALDVARKELAEEAGLVASDWEPLGSFAPYKGVSNERCWFFVARGLTVVPQRLEPSERITAHRLPLAAARELVVGQEVGDGQSMAGLLLLDRWLAARGRS